MILAFFVLVLVSAMGGALLFSTQVEVRMSQSDLRAKQAFYLAEAGEETAREALFTINGIDDLSDDLQTAAGTDGNIDFDPDAVQPVYDSAGNITDFTGYGDDVPLQPATPLGDGVFIAFLTNDPTEGVTNTTDANHLVTITGIGGGPDGSYEMVQAIVEPDRPLPEMPGAAITLLGKNPNFQGGTSNSSIYEGEDCGGAGSPGLFVPIVGTIGAEAEADAKTGIWESNGPDYTSGELTGDETFSDLTDPDDPLLAAGLGTIGDEWTNCLTLKELVEDLRGRADYSCSDRSDVLLVTDEYGERTAKGNKCDIPDGASPGDVIFVDGNLAVGKTESGGGILVVTGELLWHGQASWNGAVLAIGEGTVIRYGSGNGSLSGGVVVADIAGDDQIYGTDDDCGTGDDGFGDSDYIVDGGGTGNTTFCSTDLNAANPPEPYNIVNFRQN
jgi:hypothetical protein